MRHIQIIANEILKDTCYAVYTPKEINDFNHSQGEHEDDFEEGQSILILCTKFESTEEGNLHPGFIMTVNEGMLESHSIIPPGPFYKSFNIEEAIDAIMTYYKELEALEETHK
jgi:hypothetical protein